MSEQLGVIIFSQRANLLNAIRAELKTLGIDKEEVIYPKNRKKCLEELEKQKNTILIVDWEKGIEDCLEILESAKAQQQIDTRHTFLVAAQMDDKIIAAGTEFGVSQIHTGAITQTKIKLALNELMKTAIEVTPIRSVLLDVAQARQQGNWVTVTPVLEELVKQEPKNPRAIVELAENYIYEERWREAIMILEKIENKNPPNIRALHQLGKCLIKVGKANAACEKLKKAKLINPYNIDRLLTLGNTLLNLDRTEEASENFDELMSFAPENKAAKEGKGTCLLLEGEVNEALALLRDVSTGKELASIFNTAAILSMRLGYHAKGIGLYDSAIAALGKDIIILARLFYNKGIGFFRWKKLDNARKCFEKALELDPNYENAKHNLAALKGRAGDAFPAVSKDGKIPTEAPGSQMPTDTAPAADIPASEIFENFAFEDQIDDMFDDDLADEDERL